MSVTTAGEVINLSINIRRLREGRGWSQRELAAKLNTSHPVVNRWEQPIASITLNRLEDLADIFDVRIVDLFAAPIESKE